MLNRFRDIDKVWREHEMKLFKGGFYITRRSSFLE